jgi:hypothetical protein
MEPLKREEPLLIPSKRRALFKMGKTTISLAVPLDLWARIQEKEVYLKINRSQLMRRILELGVNALEDQIIAEDAKALKRNLEPLPSSSETAKEGS